MAVLGLGVRTWAHPPHNLRECFADYRENGTRQGTVCESGRLNRPLGTRRLNEGIAGAIVVMSLTAIAVGRMLPRPVTS